MASRGILDKGHGVGVSARPSSSMTLSLEEELAEATQDLLALQRGRQPSQDDAQVQGPSLRKPISSTHTEQAHTGNVGGSWQTPSPLRLPVHSNLGTESPLHNENENDKSGSGSSNVAQAFGIRGNARLTRMQEEGEHSDEGGSSSSGPADLLAHPTSSSSSSNGPSTKSEDHDARYPASQLHHTSAPVESHHSHLLPPGRPQSSASSQMSTIEKAIEARVQALRKNSRSLHNLRDTVTKAKQMDMLQARLDKSRSRGEEVADTLDFGNRATNVPADTSLGLSANGDFRANGSRAPAFFLQSFPEAVTYLDDAAGGPPISSRSVSPSPSRGQDAVIETSQAMEGVVPQQHWKYSGISAFPEGTANTNHNLAEDESSHMVEQGDETLQELVPAPFQRLSGEAASLLSLPATADTASSNSVRNGRSSARRRHSHMRRRQSSGNQSILTLGSSGGGGSILLDEEMADAQQPFARDVSIRGFSIVGEKARGYVAYDVRILLSTGTTISLLRRFSSFVALRRAIVQECGDGKGKQKKFYILEQATRTPGGSAKDDGSSRRKPNEGAPLPLPAVPLPPLPPRRTGLLHKYAAHHLETRRLALQRWLHIIMLDRVYGTSGALRSWVVGPDEEEEARQV